MPERDVYRVRYTRQMIIAGLLEHDIAFHTDKFHDCPVRFRIYARRRFKKSTVEKTAGLPHKSSLNCNL